MYKTEIIKSILLCIGFTSRTSFIIVKNKLSLSVFWNIMLKRRGGSINSPFPASVRSAWSRWHLAWEHRVIKVFSVFEHLFFYPIFNYKMVCYSSSRSRCGSPRCSPSCIPQHLLTQLPLSDILETVLLHHLLSFSLIPGFRLAPALLFLPPLPILLPPKPYRPQD